MVDLELVLCAEILRNRKKKIFARGFRTDLATKERGLCEKKPRRQILSCTDRANEVNKTFII